MAFMLKITGAASIAQYICMISMHPSSWEYSYMYIYCCSKLFCGPYRGHWRETINEFELSRYPLNEKLWFHSFVQRRSATVLPGNTGLASICLNLTRKHWNRYVTVVSQISSNFLYLGHLGRGLSLQVFVTWDTSHAGTRRWESANCQSLSFFCYCAKKMYYGDWKKCKKCGIYVRCCFAFLFKRLQPGR